jgi:hypothetical protein
LRLTLRYSSDLWRLAEEFGAFCTSDLDAGTTHLVTAKVSPFLTLVRPQESLITRGMQTPARHGKG